MQRSPFAPAQTEDELADQAVRRGQNAGGFWIVSSVAAFGAGFVSGSPERLILIWLVGVALFAVGLAVRARHWKSARRQLGDATMQRAQWRRADADRDGPERIIAAIALVVLLLAYELWRM